MDSNSNNQTNLTEDEIFAEEVGALVFEGALLQFLAEADEETAKAFEEYVEENAAEENFISELSETYPAFAELLNKEIATLQADMREVIPEA